MPTPNVALIEQLMREQGLSLHKIAELGGLDGIKRLDAALRTKSPKTRRDVIVAFAAALGRPVDDLIVVTAGSRSTKPSTVEMLTREVRDNTQAVREYTSELKTLIRMLT